MKLNNDIAFLIMSCCHTTHDFDGCITHYGNNVWEDKLEVPSKFIVVPEENLIEAEYDKIWVRTCDCVIIGLTGNHLVIQLYQDRDLFNWVVEDIEKQCNVTILQKKQVT